MSPSTKSAPESPSSPETGSAVDPDVAPLGTDDAAAGSTGDADDDDDDRPRLNSRGGLAIQLESSRQRAAGYAVFGLAVGALLVWKLGTVATYAGIVLLVVGVWFAIQLVQSFMRPAGTIVVDATEVRLPRGLHRGAPITVAPSAVTAVYFLRRSVPWNRAAPVLVIELGDRAMAYPRDWFASESDQRHLVHALLRDGKTARAAATPT